MSGVALVIPPDGDIREVAWPDEDQDQLDLMYVEMQANTVDVVRVPEYGVLVWVDDEGLFVQDPKFNPRASVLGRRELVGTAVVTSCTEGPETVGLPAEMANKLKMVFEVFRGMGGMRTDERA